MNSRERILNAIEGKPVDRTPVWPFVMAFSAKYGGVAYSEFATDYKKLAQAQIKTADDFELDAIAVDSDAYREASACGAVLTYPEDDLPLVTKHAIQNKSSFLFQVPDISGSERLVDKIEGVRYLKQYYQGEKAICGWIESPLQSAGTLYDLNEFMMDLYEEPEFVEELLEFTAEFGIRFALEQANAGADIIGIGDAMASMVSPGCYEQYIMPYTKKMVDGIRAKSDVKLKYHICGSAAHVLPFAKQVGFDIINVDYKIDAMAAFDVVGSSVCIKGNIDPVAVLRDGTPQQVMQAANALLTLKQPRFILSAGCEVARDTPHQNLRAMVQSVRG